MSNKMHYKLFLILSTSLAAILVMFLLFKHTGLAKIIIRTYISKVAVLTYHHIDPLFKSDVTITPELFREHLDMLQQKGYNVISIEQLADFLDGKESVPDKAVVITFDDGYESFYKYAYPELKAHHMPATNFIITSWAGKNSDGLQYLTWAEMKKMQENGMSFYVHTDHSHHLVPTSNKGDYMPALNNRAWLTQKNRLETEDEYQQRVRKDLETAKQLIETNLHKPATHLAWPYNTVHKTPSETARSSGYRFCYVSNKEDIVTSRTNPSYISRINVGSPYVTAEMLAWKIENATKENKKNSNPVLRFLVRLTADVRKLLIFDLIFNIPT
jgi:biofilm PGA synthesis lipoprotein PgaB